MSEKKDKKQDNSYLVDFSICKERLLKKQVLEIEQIEMKALNESHFKTWRMEKRAEIHHIVSWFASYYNAI